MKKGGSPYILYPTDSSKICELYLAGAYKSVTGVVWPAIQKISWILWPANFGSLCVWYDKNTFYSPPRPNRYFTSKCAEIFLWAVAKVHPLRFFTLWTDVGYVSKVLFHWHLYFVPLLEITYLCLLENSLCLKFTSGLTHAKWWASPLWLLSKKLHKINSEHRQLTAYIFVYYH